METKHKDLLERLADMEKNWDEDGENLLFFLEILFCKVAQIYSCAMI